MNVDPIARAECAQYLFRSGFDLSALAGDADLCAAAADALVHAGAPTGDVEAIVAAVATYYAP